LSHGRVAFGFFNIATDLLLLQELFFFADRFCGLALDLADQVGRPGHAAALPGWRIDDPERLGHLHGAIAGVDLSGFIGAVYRRFPFPAERSKFKQHPEGRQTQEVVTELLAAWAEPLSLTVAVTAEGVGLGSYLFSPEGWGRVVEYVWRGGMPGWRGGLRPGYVDRLATKYKLP
jgi:hypothetical protein